MKADIERELLGLSSEYNHLVKLTHDIDQKISQGMGVPIIGSFLAKRLKPDQLKVTNLVDKKAKEITETLKDRIGFYPLAWCNYQQELFFGNQFFLYGFDHTLGDHTFKVEYVRQEDYGILVQGHETTFQPQIEITPEHPHSLLHLPEGFVIPVGPLKLAADNMPIPEETVQELQKIVGNFLGFRVPKRFAPSRYFYWKPELPSTPQWITIDQANIPPLSLGLNWESAPTYTDKVEGGPKDIIIDERYFAMIEANCKLCRTLKSSR